MTILVMTDDIKYTVSNVHRIKYRTELASSLSSFDRSGRRINKFSNTHKKLGCFCLEWDGITPLDGREGFKYLWLTHGSTIAEVPDHVRIKRVYHGDSDMYESDRADRQSYTPTDEDLFPCLKGKGISDGAKRLLLRINHGQEE